MDDFDYVVCHFGCYILRILLHQRIEVFFFLCHCLCSVLPCYFAEASARAMVATSAYDRRSKQKPLPFSVYVDDLCLEDEWFFVLDRQN